MQKRNLQNIRREYTKAKLNDAELPHQPIVLFDSWMNEAQAIISEDATAMVLSTVNEKGVPSSRIVLLKDYSADGFSFFTNYNSRKGQEIEASQKVSLLFYWKELERQVRIEGTIFKLDAGTSDSYFLSRPHESQIAAIISSQSKVIEDRQLLDKSFMDEVVKNKKPMRPAEWGGYIVRANYFEFWQGRANRLHDRIVFEMENAEWKRFRLAP